MLAIMKNDWNRIMQQKMGLCVSIGLTIISVILAVVFTNKLQPKFQIAVSGDVPAYLDSSDMESESVVVTKMENEPLKSELVQGKYTAIVTFAKDGSYEIQTAKSEEFKNNLDKLLKGEPVEDGNALSGEHRKIGTNIIGFMMMFILMQGISYTRLFVEDKEKKQITRVVCSSIRFHSYIMGHVLFTWLFIFVPTFLIVVVMKLTGMSIGFALWQYALILGIMALLATSFAIFTDSLFDTTDTANMLGNALIVLTTILSGSFYDMSGGSVASKVLNILPQKDLVNFIENWEGQNLTNQNMIGLGYLCVFILVTLTFGIMKTRKDYIYAA